MKPPVHYYGGKARLAPWIVSLMPAHRVYIEPFFGSGAVLFAKPPATHEIVNDLDGNVVNFWRQLRDNRAELERVCFLTPFARQEFENANLDDPPDDDLERARRWWLRCMQAFGRLEGKSGWTASTKQGATGPLTSKRLVGRFADCCDRLANVMIEHADAVSVVERYDDRRAVLYLDPPYLHATRAGLAKRPRDYRVDMPAEDDHRRLAKTLHECEGTVILSGYPSDLYDELYGDWWTAARVITRHSTHHLEHRTGEKATETLWANRPLHAGTLFDQ